MLFEQQLIGSQASVTFSENCRHYRNPSSPRKKLKRKEVIHFLVGLLSSFFGHANSTISYNHLLSLDLQSEILVGFVILQLFPVPTGPEKKSVAPICGCLDE
ncbi:hypothetical protein V6N11_006903 [Hibiscus sabdariffa]|uniref:Uncharacterized protein n=1 Tax=Hibiscus sabdariffa TaxID=183260 RepID=A0ABR2RSG9_9ROSI